MRPFRKTFTQQAAEQTTVFHSRLLYWLRELGRLFFLLACAVGTAYLVTASYPKHSRSVLAWFALAPFVWGVCKTRGFLSCFVYSWFTGLLLNAGVFDWIYYTCLNGGGLSRELSLAVWLGLSALLAVQFALFGGGCYFLRKAGGFFPLLAACGFVAWEWLHQTLAFYGLGFPWLMLGYTQWNMPEMIQIAAWTGVYGVSFALAFTGASVGWAFAVPEVKRGAAHMFLAAAVFVGMFAFGHFRLPAVLSREGRPLLSLSAALMQPSIDQYKKWSPEFEAEITSVLEEMGRSLEEEKVMLSVWPESAVPGSLLEERYRNLFEDIASRSGAYQLVGSNVPDGNTQYVGAYLLTPDSDELQEYRKIKLVPFGEYIPLEKTVRALFKNVAVLGELGSFTPGPREQKPLNLAGVLLGRTICYESIYPQLWLSQNRQGAQFFVNITNDAWFFDTSAPYQHLAVNVLRAVETGRPVLRAANTGFSAVVDPFGRIEKQSGLFTREILRVSVPLAVGDQTNFYTRWGDWFAWFCAAIYFTLLISAMVFSYE